MRLALIPILATSWLLAHPCDATEIHVSPAGNDGNPGTISSPLKTISAAAAKAMPGDTVTVHAGTYRERVDPPRGGTGDNARIVYQAAAGEKVVITGSEPAKGWEKVGGDTWKWVTPSSTFGNFNPYSDTIRGDWFKSNKRVHHTGCVYLNGDWMIEAAKLDEVMKPPGKTSLWFATVDGDDGSHLLNLAMVKTAAGASVSGGEPSFRYGGKANPCSEGGTYSGSIRHGDWLRFDALDFGAGSAAVELRAAAQTGAGGVIELRLNDPAGELLGNCEVAATGDWQKWQTFTAKIKPLSGKQTLCLVFKSSKVDEGKTTIYAQFPGVDPNMAQVEINRRQTVFYPSRNFINYITVRGFVLENAAANWAPPSSEQTAVIGTNWSKGWIIENNTVRYSKCSGISLGKYGDGTDNTNDAGAADPYTACVRRALERGWNKATIGSHVVRNNHIHHCEQTGIVGSMGCAFSQVIGNEIHDIHVHRLFSGAEMAGIKFHGAVDAEIRDNHLHHCGAYGLWLDWMTQGAHVTGNLLHDNNVSQDIFLEMQHGPLVIANNLLLSKRNFLLNSKGIAVVHNLLTGDFKSTSFDSRNTPFHPAHSTEIAGIFDAPGGDHRFYNNLCAGSWNGNALDNVKLPCMAAGNVFTNGAKPSKFDIEPLVKPDFDARVKLIQKDDGWYLTLAADPAWRSEAKCQVVTTRSLGNAKIPNLPYENTDGTPMSIETDYFGTKRDSHNPFPGPFEISAGGIKDYKVWPK